MRVVSCKLNKRKKRKIMKFKKIVFKSKKFPIVIRAGKKNSSLNGKA